MGHERLYLIFLILILKSPFIACAQELSYNPIPKERLIYIQEELDRALKGKDSLGIAEAWYLFGKTYAGSGDYKASQLYYLKSLAILERYGNSYKLGRLYLRFSQNELIQGNYPESFRYGEDAKNVFEQIKSERGIESYYGNLSRIYKTIWDEDSLKSPVKFDSLLAIYKKTESLAKKQNNFLQLAETNLFLGNLIAKTDPKLALTHMDRALRLYADKNETGTAYAYLSKVPVYVSLGEYQSALEALNKTDQYYKESKINSYEFQVTFLQNYILYFQEIGNWEKAFEFLQKLNNLEKKKIIADRNGAISRLHLEYETEKKKKLLLVQQREIALKNSNLKIQQRFTWTFATLLVAAISTVVIYFRLYRKNQQTSHWNAELLKEQNHRVKNNLQIVSSLLNMQSKRLTDKMAKKAVEETRLRIESMAILHRRLYDGDKFAKVNLDEFIQELVEGVLKSYGHDHIRPVFDISSVALVADKAVRLGLILNELSTNACKYAFPFTDEPQFKITCFCANNKLELVVRDNGPGLPNSFLDIQDHFPDSKNGTFGLSLIKTQVIQLNGSGRFKKASAWGTGAEFILDFKFT